MIQKELTFGRRMLDRFRSFNRTRISRRRLAKEAVMTPHGFKFNGLAEMQDGTFEPDETKLVKHLLRQVDVFVNVGANSGYYCCFAQQSGIETIAIEPIPTNVHYIGQNMRANGWGENISVFPVAVGDLSGFIDIYGIGTGASVIKGWANNPVSLKQTVPVVRLDKLVHPAPNGKTMFILMDVEGFEYQALMGAEKLINSANKPIWFIEIIGNGGPIDESETSIKFMETFKLMINAGYAVYDANESMDPILWDDILQLDMDPNQRNSSRNYLFVDKDINIQTLKDA